MTIKSFSGLLRVNDSVLFRTLSIRHLTLYIYLRIDIFCFCLHKYCHCMSSIIQSFLRGNKTNILLQFIWCFVDFLFCFYHCVLHRSTMIYDASERLKMCISNIFLTHCQRQKYISEYGQEYIKGTEKYSS